MSIVSGTHGAPLPICPPQPLPTYLHTCGQPIQLGQRFTGYQLMPVFWILDTTRNTQHEPRNTQHVTCPLCRQTLRTTDLLQPAQWRTP